MTVQRCLPHVVQCRILTGSNAGEIVFIPRITSAPKTNGLPFTLKRQQLPLRLSYAMTINKAQGQEFESVGVYLPKPVFSHWQLYVACSRAKSWKLDLLCEKQVILSKLENGILIHIYICQI
jgi:ATP-dependent DNA helicase PIF1